jgi:hypothetical protein
MSENSLTANELYFGDVEGEQGIELTLDEKLRNNLVGLITDRYVSAKTSTRLRRN